jgi:hypothetical protein
MPKKGRIWAAFVLLTVTTAHSQETETGGSNMTIPPAGDIVARLRKEHPRLLATAQDFARVRTQAANNAQLKERCNQLRKRVQDILSEPPDSKEYFQVYDRVCPLALLYQLDKDRRYAERAWQELQAAKNLPDWNPSGFLKTAGMTLTFAIGYDWLYDAWTEEQRAVLRGVIVEKGLKPGLEAYRGAGFGWWAKDYHNWNRVCNGGLAAGAVAVGSEAPEISGEVLHAALQSMKLSQDLAERDFAPDGGWNEGVGYWAYAMSYHVVFLAALESALGTDFGLSKASGFSETGYFPLYLSGPLGRFFNFADSGNGEPVYGPQIFWLARRFDRPIYAWYQRQAPSPHGNAFNVLWFDARGDGPRATNLPLDKYFRGVEIATFRSAWEDRNAVFVGFKAGDNTANHGHLDLGTFVLDALGVRWALDLGSEDYNLPGYFGNLRWTYYRLRAEGHNTLTIDPSDAPDQEPSALARIIRFRSDPARAYAIADLTPAYPAHIRRDWSYVDYLAPSRRSDPANERKVQRGIALLNRQQVLVQDEVHLDKPAEVWWFMHTPAQIQVSDDGTAAVLTQGKERLWARILSPKEARFSVREAEPLPTSPHPEKQAINKDIRKLAVHTAGVTELRLAVLFVPLREGESAPARLPEISPLERW